MASSSDRKKPLWDILSMGYLLFGLIYTFIISEMEKAISLGLEIELNWSYQPYLILGIIFLIWKFIERFYKGEVQFQFTLLESSWIFIVADLIFIFLGFQIGQSLSENWFFTLIAIMFIVYYGLYLFRIWRQKVNGLINSDHESDYWWVRMFVLFALFLMVLSYYIFNVYYSALPIETLERHRIYWVLLGIMFFDLLGRILVWKYRNKTNN